MIGVVMGVASLVGSGMQMIGGAMNAKEARRVAKYNAKVALEEGLGRERAITAQAEQMAIEGRSDISTAQGIMANRGIQMKGSPILALTNVMADVYADQSELKRQADIARMRGETGSAQLEYKADAIRAGQSLSLLGQGIGAIGSAVGTYHNMEGKNSAFYKD